MPASAGLQWLAYDPYALAPAAASGGGLLPDSISNSFAASPLYTPAYLGNTSLLVTLSDTCVMGSANMWVAAVCNLPVALNVSAVAPATAVTVPRMPAALYVPYGPGAGWSTATFNAQASRGKDGVNSPFVTPPPCAPCPQAVDPEGDSVTYAWTIISRPTTALTPDSAAAAFAGVSLGAAGQTVTYEPSVLGVDSATLVLGANMTALATLSPSFIGSWALTVAVSDACTVTTALVNVTVGCGSPPRLTIAGAVGATYYAVWGGPGVGFLPALLDASPTMPGGPGRNLSFTWGAVTAVSYNASSPVSYAGPTRLVPAGVISVPLSAAQILPAALVSSGALQYVSPINGSTGAVVSFTPGAIGTYTLPVAVSDRCAVTRASLTVYAVCGATPAASVACLLPNASTGVGGASAFVNLWLGGNIWRAPLPVSTQVRSTAGRIYARYFANVTLNGSATTAGSLGIAPRLAWAVVSHTPVAVPAAGPVAGSPLNMTWVSAPLLPDWLLCGLHVYLLLPLHRSPSQSAYAPPFVLGRSVEPALAGSLVASNWSTAAATAAAFSSAASSVAPIFSPSKLGRYVVSLTADDGCSSSSVSLTIDYRCPVAPGVSVASPLIITSQRDATQPFPPTALQANVYDNAEYLVSATWYLLPVRGVEPVRLSLVACFKLSPRSCRARLCQVRCAARREERPSRA